MNLCAYFEASTEAFDLHLVPTPANTSAMFCKTGSNHILELKALGFCPKQTLHAVLCHQCHQTIATSEETLLHPHSLLPTQNCADTAVNVPLS